MSWLNLNDSLNNLKGQISNFANNVLADNSSGSEPLDELCELKKNYSAQQEEIQHLKNALENETKNAKENKSTLQLNIIQLEKEKDELVKNLELLDYEYQQNNEKIIDIKDKLQNEFNSLEQKHEELQNENKNLIMKINNLENHSKQDKPKINSDEFITDQCKKCKEYLVDFQKLEAEIGKLQSEVAILTSNNATLNKIIEEMKYVNTDDAITNLSDIPTKSLFDELHKAKQTLKEYEEKFAADEENCKKLDQILEAYDEQVSELKSKLSGDNNKFEELKKSLKDEKEQLNKKYINILTENIRHLDDTNNFHYKFNDDESDLIQFDNQVKKLVKILLDFKQKSQDLKQQIINISQEKTNVLTDKNFEIEKLIQNSELLSQEIILKSQAIKDYENEIYELITKNELLMNEIKSYKNNSGLQTISETNEDNLLMLEGQLEVACKKIQDLEKCDKLKEIEKLKNEIRLIEGDKEILTEEKDELCSVIERMKTDLELKENKYIDIINTVADLKLVIQIETNKVQELYNYNQKLKDLNFEYEKSNEDTRTELNNLRGKLLFEEDYRKQYESQVHLLNEKLQKSKMSETTYKLLNDTITKELNAVNEMNQILQENCEKKEQKYELLLSEINKYQEKVNIVDANIQCEISIVQDNNGGINVETQTDTSFVEYINGKAEPQLLMNNFGLIKSELIEKINMAPQCQMDKLYSNYFFKMLNDKIQTNAQLKKYYAKLNARDQGELVLILQKSIKECVQTQYGLSPMQNTGIQCDILDFNKEIKSATCQSDLNIGNNYINAEIQCDLQKKMGANYVSVPTQFDENIHILDSYELCEHKNLSLEYADTEIQCDMLEFIKETESVACQFDITLETYLADHVNAEVQCGMLEFAEETKSVTCQSDVTMENYLIDYVNSKIQCDLLKKMDTNYVSVQTQSDISMENINILELLCEKKNLSFGCADTEIQCDIDVQKIDLEENSTAIQCELLNNSNLEKELLQFKNENAELLVKINDLEKVFKILTADIHLKYQENVTYHNEIQRLSTFLNIEIEKNANFQLQFKKTLEKLNELKSKDETIEKIIDENNFLKEKCDIITKNLLEEQTECQKLLDEISNQSSDKEIQLNKKLERLQNHLIEVEEHYTQELVKAEEKIQQLMIQLSEIEQREKDSSTMYTSVSIRTNQHVEALQNQIQILSKNRDELKKKYDESEENIIRQQTALTNLQFVLEKVQKEKDKAIQDETHRLRKQIAFDKQIHEQLKQEINNLHKQLEEGMQGLQAATRLSDQLEMLKRTNTALKEEVSTLKDRLQTSDDKIKILLSTNDGKVDKSLIKNLIIGLMSISGNINKDQTQILKIIGSVLDFNQQDNEKLKLETTQALSLLPFQNAHGEVGSPSNDSLSKAFVKFLENESKPRVVPNLLLKDSENKAIVMNQSSSGKTAGILSEVVLPTFSDFAQNRNSSSILKDVLKDRNST